MCIRLDTFCCCRSVSEGAKIIAVIQIILAVVALLPELFALNMAGTNDMFLHTNLNYATLKKYTVFM